MCSKNEKKSFQEILEISDGGIVGIWDIITRILACISLLNMITYIWKKIIRYDREKYYDQVNSLKNEVDASKVPNKRHILKNNKEGYKLYINMSRLYEFITVWVSCHMFLAIAMSLIMFFGIEAEQRWLIYSISIYGIWRIFEIVIKQIRIILFETIGKYKISIKGARRSIILLMHNIVEMIFWFACSFMATCILDTKAIAEDFIYLSDIYRWSDFIRCSTLQFTIYGDSYTSISGLIMSHSILINIVFWEIIVGFVIMVISLGRFIGLLPNINSEEML